METDMSCIGWVYLVDLVCLVDLVEPD